MPAVSNHRLSRRDQLHRLLLCALLLSMSRVAGKPAFCICVRAWTRISFAVTAKVMCAFAFATYIVQSLYFLKSKFLAPGHLVRLHSLVCVGPGLKPVFSQRGLYITSFRTCFTFPILTICMYSTHFISDLDYHEHIHGIFVHSFHYLIHYHSTTTL